MTAARAMVMVVTTMTTMMMRMIPRRRRRRRAMLRVAAAAAATRCGCHCDGERRRMMHSQPGTVSRKSEGDGCCSACLFISNQRTRHRSTAGRGFKGVGCCRLQASRQANDSGVVGLLGQRGSPRECAGCFLDDKKSLGACPPSRWAVRVLPSDEPSFESNTCVVTPPDPLSTPTHTGVDRQRNSTLAIEACFVRDSWVCVC